MTGERLDERARELAARRAPFVVATVVRAQRPTSVRPGDAALVLADGTIDGFVGGTCAEQSVRLHALRTLETGEPLLLRIMPGDDDAPAVEGAVTVQNPCLSGGAMDIFLEPRLPAPRVVVIGDTPIAAALARLGAELDVDVAAGGEPADGDLALVVASHGRDELGALRSALELGLPYVGLVASRRRGAAVAEDLRREGADPAALDTPAGLDIGARTPAEIALAILGRIVAVRRSRALAPAAAASDAAGVPAGGGAPAGAADAPAGAADAPAGAADAMPDAAEAPPRPLAIHRTAGATAAAPREAVDPVCGMTVVVGPGTPSLQHEGELVHFCCDGCLRAFQRDHAAAG